MIQERSDYSDVEKLFRRWIDKGAELRALRTGIRMDLERQQLEVEIEIPRK
jgi:hypothetical protein